MLNDIGMQNSKWEIFLAAGDVAVFLAAIPMLLLWHLQLGQAPQFFPGGWDVAIFVLLGINLLVIYISDLYDKYKDYRDFENISRIIFAVWIGMMLGGLVIRFSKDLYLRPQFYRMACLVFYQPADFLALSLFRSGAAPAFKRRLLIVGAGDSGRRILESHSGPTQQRFKTHRFCGRRPGESRSASGRGAGIGPLRQTHGSDQSPSNRTGGAGHHSGQIAEAAENSQPFIL